MADYNSKYSGEQIEELLDMVANGEVGGGIEAETDPIFSASPAATITEEKMTEWDGKQDTIADLATIRSGAEKGATALQSVPSEYGTKAWVTEQARDIANDAVGDFEAVAVEPLAVELSTLREDFDTLVSGDTTTAIKTFNEVIAFLDGLTDTQDLESIIASIEQQIAGKMDNVTLAKVATSGSYNDLSNKPTIPSAVTESTVSGWGFTKNTGTYSKPSGGIPKSDLTSEVQTSLGKADTALQSYTEQYKGTITGVSANGTSVATSGVANIPAASTSVYGVTKLSSSTSSTSTTLAATASAVKSAYDLANSYKGTVTGVKVNGSTKSPSSGTVDIGNVVTSVKLNGTTYSPSSGVVDLGSVSGGSSSGGSTKEVIEVEAVESPIGFEVSFVNAQPNKIYICKDAVAWASINYIQPTSDTISDYTFIFKSDIVGMTLETFVNVKWANDIPPVLEANKVYEVSLRGINWGGYTTYQGIIASFALGSAMSGGDND